MLHLLLLQGPVPVIQSGPVVTTPASNVSLYLAFASTTITAILTFVVAYLGIRQKASAEQAAAASDKQAKKIDEIHTFTNSALGAAKRGLAVALRVIANQSKDPAAMKAADAAEEDSRNHDESQKTVDALKLAEANTRPVT